MGKRFSDHQPTNLSPDSMFTSEIIKFEDIPEGQKAEIKANKPIEVRVNGGKWIQIIPE
jgi:hypothetical protein